MMPISESEERMRRCFVEEAREAPFLDSVFLLLYYNHDVKRWGPSPKPPDIDPVEVFGAFDEEQYRSAAARVDRLMRQSQDVGMAFFRHPQSTRSYEEELALFEKENPGFGERSYALAISAGIRDMR